jgi:hypothetical protein
MGVKEFAYSTMAYDMARHFLGLYNDERQKNKMLIYYLCKSKRTLTRYINSIIKMNEEVAD